MVINKNLIRKRFGKAVNSYHKAAHIQHQIATELMHEALNWVPQKEMRLLEVGCGSGFLTQQMKDNLLIGQWVVNDLSSSWKECIDGIVGETNYVFVEGDAEDWPFEGEFDLIASCSTLQWFARPNCFVRRALQHLNSNGLLMISSFGKQNLKEVRELSGKGLNYPDLKQIADELSEEMDCHFWEQEQEMVFNSGLDVLKHLKATGVTATNSDLWTRRKITLFCERYEHQFQTKGGVRLTYHPTYLLIKKRR